jgi:hypothetical protein|tara:strand:- start:2387 stop:2596 length:210 start_codon:yes stop_codon:yes gene_type:complete
MNDQKESLLNALVAKYNGQIMEAKANIDVYSNAVGIGEHSDIIAELDKQVAMMTDASDKLEQVMHMLNG